MKHIKIILAFLHDFFAVIFSWFLAYALRFNFDVPSEHIEPILKSLPTILLISTLSFYFIGLYRGVWRFASITDLKKIIISVLAASVIFIAFLFMYKEIGLLPRSVLVIHPLLLILIMGGSRFVYRTFREHQLYGLKASIGEPVIIIGSSQNAIALSKELNLTNEWRVIGMLTNDESLLGRELGGTRILGTINELPKLQEKFSIHKVIIASDEISHNDRRVIIQMTSSLGIEVLTIPFAADLVSGRLNISQIRSV